MIDIIKNILLEEKIETYLITESKSDSAELFFIKRALDVRRKKSVRKYEVTIYHDFEKNGEKMRGSSKADIFPSMEKDEIRDKLKEAYYAASFVCNPYFELPQGVKEDSAAKPSELASMPLEESAIEAAKALYSQDMPQGKDNSSVEKQCGTFINSTEIFSCRTSKRIVGSNGTDVSYVKHSINGEFVVQCIENEDVEFYSQFEYDELDRNALAEKAKDALEAVRARSYAKHALKSGRYTVIIDKENLVELLSYYLDRANASNIYAKYSDYNIGGNVQGDDIKGELLNISVLPSAPYSAEGIPMRQNALITEGKLDMIHGSTRFCRYLDIPPVGTYSKIKLSANGKSLDEMKAEPHLYIVKFSDFGMDTLSGHFGGEIRLAYLFDGNETHIITGGSINGSITDAQKDLEFSKEEYHDSKYTGPLALKMKNISVAGI